MQSPNLENRTTARNTRHRAIRAVCTRVLAVTFLLATVLTGTAFPQGTTPPWALSNTQPLLGPSGEVILHVGRIETIRYSPTGQYLETEFDEVGPFLYNLSTRRPVHFYQGEIGMAFSPDGKLYLTRSFDTDGELVTRYVRTGESFDTVSLSALSDLDSIVSGAVTPSGPRILTTRDDGSSTIWFMDEEPIKARVYEDREFTVLSSDGTRMLQENPGEGPASRSFTIWDADLDEEILTTRVDINPTAWFTGDSMRLLTIGTVIDVWNLETGELEGTYPVNAPSACEAISGNGSRYATITGTRADVWDVVTGEQVISFDPGDGLVRDVALSPNGSRVTAVCMFNTVHTYRSDVRPPVSELENTLIRSNGALFSPDSRALLIAGYDDRLITWDINRLRVAGVEQQTGTYDFRWVSDLAFTPNGKLMGSTHGKLEYPIQDGQLAQIWDTASGEVIRTYVSDNSLLYSIDLDPNERYALIGGSRKSVLYDIEQDSIKFVLNPAVNVVYSPNGHYGLADSSLWDIETGVKVHDFPGGLIVAAAFTPDSSSLYAVRAVEQPSGTHELCLLDVETGETIQRVVKLGCLTPSPIAPSGTRAVAFSGDLTRVVTACGQYAVIRDTRTGEIVRKLGPHALPVECVAFSPNQKWVTTAESYGPLRAWPNRDDASVLSATELTVEPAVVGRTR